MGVVCFLYHQLYLPAQRGSAEGTSCYTIKAVTSPRGVENTWKTERDQLLQNDTLKIIWGNFIAYTEESSDPEAFQ